jgi:hypothetical protein
MLADRGLYAPWLYRQIVAQGWHPFLRINLRAKACVQASDRWEWISQWLPAVGQQWAARVAYFAVPQTRLDCTLLLCQESGYAEPWVIVTDLPPQQVHAAWYRLRAWIEGGFKDYKRGQWGRQHTKMRDPERAERLWLALAVSTLWAAGHPHPTPKRVRERAGSARRWLVLPLPALRAGSRSPQWPSLWERRPRRDGGTEAAAAAAPLPEAGRGAGGKTPFPPNCREDRGQGMRSAPTCKLD